MTAARRNKAEKFWDRTAGHYDKEEQKDEKIYRGIIERTKDFLTSADTILDFGCGTGTASNELSAVVKEIHAFDTSSRMIEIARSKTPKKRVTYIHSTIFDNRLKTDFYDAVLGFYILHLLEDPQPAVSKIYERLKPGGLFLSVTPCMGEKPFLARVFSLLGKLGMAPEMQPLKPAGLERLITAASFTIIESSLLPGTKNQYFIAAKKAAILH
ncbi:class I SAM-dependent methyltransferase [Niabella beijingensis]|uniref:class I SAM-dependent methyltransferase n=1 Tax=Niabella beijingensis TaxID=2872700 RepID=UPI001CC03434|nr:class I SAM-dependent methyltransferase [Niabella beijingensis]MBZ4192493.1 class I SAM-dependent methyltransferase [Niabella beijingensis]